MFLAIAYCAFHFASWKFIWNENISYWDLILINLLEIGKANDSFILLRDAFAIRINDGYYGIANTKQYLDSPVLSWILLFVSLGSVSLAFNSLFGIKDDDDDDDDII